MFTEEDRRKDKIVAAAREKIALQLERKKKLAEFLRLKTVPTEALSNRVEERVRTPEKKQKISRSKTKESKPKVEEVTEIFKIDDSDSEEGEIKKHKKSSKKKKSHKR